MRRTILTIETLVARQKLEKPQRALKTYKKPTLNMSMIWSFFFVDMDRL